MRRFLDRLRGRLLCALGHHKLENGFEIGQWANVSGSEDSDGLYKIVGIETDGLSIMDSLGRRGKIFASPRCRRCRRVLGAPMIPKAPTAP